MRIDGVYSITVSRGGTFREAYSNYFDAMRYPRPYLY